MTHHLGVPILGTCFGSQALATALGGSVEPSPRPEIGWIHVETDVSDLVTPGPWLDWHYARCALPPCAVHLT